MRFAARAVIGIGLNVRMPAAMAAGIDQPWLDLQALASAPPARNAVVAMLLQHLLPALDCFDAQGLAPFLPRYAALDALAGRRVQAVSYTHLDVYKRQGRTNRSRIGKSVCRQRRVMRI